MNLAMEELSTTLAAMIQCFDWKVVNPPGANPEACNTVLDMSERPGLTAPRAQDLVCVPLARIDNIIVS
uniref:Uncharacterized protein n=1 Tax=Rhizophora mucronata TaxID=61149 RepID=A0A2P2J4E0_RHIMU